LIEQIVQFINVLRAAEASPQRVLFSLKKFPSSTEYILSGDRLLYNKNIKLFHKVLRDLLFGTLDVSCTSIGHLPAEPILFFDVHQFVWETVNRISDEDIDSICKGMDSISVSKTSHPVKDFSLFSRDSLDSMVVFYFQLLPKPANVFLQDFETTKRVHYYRSVLRMALLDYIRLEAVASETIIQKIEPIQFSKPQEISSEPPSKTVTEDSLVPPLKKVIEESKVEEVINKQIKEILHSEPIAPALQTPVEKKSDGTNVKMSKAKIENLKKILRNIKQL